MAQATMYFPSDFLWGTATSSHQVEGNNTNNDWWHWEQQNGSIVNGHQSGRACNWWQDAEIDFDEAAELGTGALRLSLEWSRIEPEPSVFDQNALDRYRELLQALHRRSIEPMVTLHHFSNPMWLVEKGDFSSGLVVDYFQRYVTKVVNSLGDVIPKWITINAPFAYAYARYVAGTFPKPKNQGWSAASRALRNMLRCHAAAYHTIKDAYPKALVGVAKNMIAFDPPPQSSKLNIWWTGQLSWLYNEWWMEAMRDGRLRRPFGKGRIKGLADSFDFCGINYYSRSYASFPHLFQQERTPAATMTNGDYSEVYAAGLFRVIKHARRYQRPIYITENGVPDAADRVRPAFLIAHLREVWRALSFNWPVMGYYHRSLVDGFAWDQGWAQRFGLIALDPETQERQPRRSAQLYSEICHSGSVSSDMAERYAPDLLNTLFPG